MKLLRILLFPIVPIYYLVTWFRNLFYDLGWKTSTSFSFPVICVGNLSTGGTGKTPMIEYLVSLLKQDYELATLSRGYGRKTKGFRLAGKEDTAETLGDEPFQFYNKFKEFISVAVDSNRVRGINELLSLQHPDVVLLDDAFQHRKVKAGLNILLTTYNDLYINDFVLPTGNLREPKTGAKRADIIVVTKCPDNLLEEERRRIVGMLQPKAHQQVFFSYITYSKHVFTEVNKLPLAELKPFTLVTGIANPKPLLNVLNEKGLHFNHMQFKDHHAFSDKDITKITTNNKVIVTTEKDYMRLLEFKALKSKLFYLPIEIGFYDTANFNKVIKSFIKAF
ncbi:tetraacyldisaccharide 4'-kinase [Mangrovimonas spongiae]|uniref:Tetraacyldisaccharide 4'-kinase n=1 Tax=Mangrovimonas spongiae TaxID=2494697 RepID=A0A428K6H4_9FLAO|nr:tetraacyldisaccharide 4'-kinase [Mangrovimonas spongiae]RSK42027.1 tetraacyldisaccharide 4'-kinase [Mangrovimonas spongiae]